MIYGEQLRIPGARPISRAVPALMEDNWDRRFWLAKIPLYDSSRDPHVKIRRPNSLSSTLFRVSSTRAVSRHSRVSSNFASPTVHRTPSRQLFSRTDADLLEMRKDLESTWDREGVPDFHRQVYLKHIDTLNSHTALLTISKELADLQQRKTPFQLVLASIRKRENLLVQLKDLETDIDDERLLQLDLRDILQQIQRASIDTIENINRWRELAGSQAAFPFEGQNYLLKMKVDLVPFARGPLGQFLPHVAQDPMLTRTLGRDRRQSSTLLTRQRSKAQDAELVLAKEVNPDQVVQEEEVNVQDGETDVFVIQEQLDKSESLASSFTLYSQQTSEVAKQLTLDLVTLLVEQSVRRFCSEACSELLTAHMVLYTNKILDDVISLALKEQIPICAHEAYTEEIDREFITLQKQILETVITREVENGVEAWALEVVAEEITKEFAAIVKVEDVVEESISEETVLNQLMISDIFQRLTDSYMAEEWLEIMCEDVLSDEILNERLDQLPQQVLKQILKENPTKHTERMAEFCYTNLLFHYVGELWLHRVVEECVQEARGLHKSLDVFLKAESPRRSGRRVTRMFHKS